MSSRPCVSHAPVIDAVRVVVDASVIVQVLSSGSLGPLEHHELIAPPLLASEVTSAFCEMAFRGEVPVAAAELAVERLTALPIVFERPTELAISAWRLARSLGWARSYDAEYVALAQLTSCPLITIDERLRRRVGDLVEVPLPTELGLG
jgi:predicted nucleic acid-binding protein